MRQGCPISTKIFDLVIQSLGDRIRHNPNIKGIIINNKEEKGAQYADFLWLLLLAEDN